MEKIIVFGCGDYFEKKKESIQSQFEITAFIDNRINKNSEIYKDSTIPILNPDNIKKFPQYKILLASKNFIGMWKQLLDLHVKTEILFAVNLPPYDKDGIYVANSNIIACESELCYLSETGEKHFFSSVEEYGELRKQICRQAHDYSNWVKNIPIEPISRTFGLDRGKSIDRYYIEQFLQENSNLIKGDVMEIADNQYTKKFGEGKVKNSYILHIEGGNEEGIIKGDLSTGEGIQENWVDCLIITQTLPVIFELYKTAENIVNLLKPGGVALITVPGIVQISRYDMDRWGHYWSFTNASIRKLFEKFLQPENIQVYTYGNLKTAISLLAGLCYEDLEEEDFINMDEDYQVVITAIVRR